MHFGAVLLVAAVLGFTSAQKDEKCEPFLGITIVADVVEGNLIQEKFTGDMLILPDLASKVMEGKDVKDWNKRTHLILGQDNIVYELHYSYNTSRSEPDPLVPKENVLKYLPDPGRVEVTHITWTDYTAAVDGKFPTGKLVDDLNENVILEYIFYFKGALYKREKKWIDARTGVKSKDKVPDSEWRKGDLVDPINGEHRHKEFLNDQNGKPIQLVDNKVLSRVNCTKIRKHDADLRYNNGKIAHFEKQEFKHCFSLDRCDIAFSPAALISHIQVVLTKPTLPTTPPVTSTPVVPTTVKLEPKSTGSPSVPATSTAKEATPSKAAGDATAMSTSPLAPPPTARPTGASTTKEAIPAKTAKTAKSISPPASSTAAPSSVSSKSSESASSSPKMPKESTSYGSTGKSDPSLWNETASSTSNYTTWNESTAPSTANASTWSTETIKLLPLEFTEGTSKLASSELETTVFTHSISTETTTESESLSSSMRNLIIILVVVAAIIIVILAVVGFFFRRYSQVMMLDDVEDGLTSVGSSQLGSGLTDREPDAASKMSTIENVALKSSKTKVA